MIVLGLALTAVLGWLTLPRKLDADPVAGLSLGFLWMTFGISVELFVLDRLGLPGNAWAALVPWVGAAGWLVARERPRLTFDFGLGAGVAAAATAAALLIWLPYERAMPLTSQSWDAWAIWLFKAKAFFLDGEIGGYLSRTAEFTGQPGYPLLTPLYATWLYGLVGSVDDQGAKLLSPCCFVALLGALWYGINRLGRPLIAGIAVAACALTPMVAGVAFDLAGYADTTLSAYFVAAAGFLVLWRSEKRPTDLIAGSLAATAAAWTKNEGQLFLAMFALIAAAELLRERASWKSWAWLAAPPAMLLGAWSWTRSAFGVEAAGFALGVDFQPALFAAAATSMVSKALAPGSFVLAFPLAAAAVAALAWRRAPAHYWIPSALLGWQLAGALLAYATGRNEIQWWLETSGDRILAQLAPLAILSAATAATLMPQSEPPAPAEVQAEKAGNTGKKARKRRK